MVFKTFCTAKLDKGRGVAVASNFPFQKQKNRSIVAADIALARERLFAASNKHSNPALEGFGMDMENATECIGILTTVEQEDGVQALGDTTIIGLFEATPHILMLRTAQGEQLLTHGNS
jgi:hypothetical protein